MGINDEYDMDPVEAEEAEGYREAVSAEADDIGLDDVYELWRDAGMDQRNEAAYAAAADYLEGLDLNQEAITRFCTDTALEGVDGLFLSAVVDKAPDESVTLPDLSKVDYVGYQAEKDLHIQGGVRDRCGGWLDGGSIHVSGDARAETGKFMHSGDITVEGDTGASCGQGMHDGDITVYGDATGEGGTVASESYLGEWMSGGDIVVFGDTGDWIGRRMKGGCITVKEDAGSHAGYYMTHGLITIGGTAGESLGHSIHGGVIEAGSTQHPVGPEMRAGTIRVLERVDGVWPPIGPDAHGDIIYGSGDDADQVWPPNLDILGRSEPRREVD